MSQIKPTLLITGVTGYVGHHILQIIDKTYSSYTVYATHNARKPTIKSNNPLKTINYIQLDLADNKSIKSAVDIIFKNNIHPQIIIHCAAIASPTFSEQNKDKTMKINFSTVFVETLLSYYKQQKIDKDPLFIFFSTDHVYDGQISHSNAINNDNEEKKIENKMDAIYNEESPCHPVNNYGKSKLLMEKYLLMHWKNLVILRCSAIFGPHNQQKTTLVQFVVNSLKSDKNKEVILFKNEKRNFIAIWSVVKTVEYFINEYYENEYHDIYNCGGLEALTRAEFGEICGQTFGLNIKKINAMNRFECKQQWANIAPNPEDVSMSSNKLYEELKDFYKFPLLLDSLKQIKNATEMNSK